MASDSIPESASSGPGSGAAKADPHRTMPPPGGWKEVEETFAGNTRETKYPPESPESEIEYAEVELSEAELLPGSAPPPSDGTVAQEIPKGPPPFPALIPPPKKEPTSYQGPVLDWSGMKENGQPPPSVRSVDRSQSGVGSVTGSSLSSQTHLAIDERLQTIAKITLPNVSGIELAVLRDLASMLLYQRWIRDEAKLRPALIAFLLRTKKEPNESRLQKARTSFLEGLFFTELDKLNKDLSKGLRANKDQRSPPASHG